MAHRRRLTTWLSVGLLLGGQVARADTGPGVASGTWAANVGPSIPTPDYSRGSVSWNANVSPKTVSLLARGVNLGSGMCESTYFDWGLHDPILGDPHHYDARAVRTCQSLTTVTRSWSDSRSDIEGVQKTGICYALNNTQSTGGSCVQYSGNTSSINNIPKSWVNPSVDSCAVSWTRRSSTGQITPWSSAPSDEGTSPC